MLHNNNNDDAISIYFWVVEQERLRCLGCATAFQNDRDQELML